VGDLNNIKKRAEDKDSSADKDEESAEPAVEKKPQVLI